MVGTTALTAGAACQALLNHGSDVLWALEIRGNHRDYGPPWGSLGWGRWPHRYLELIRLLDNVERTAKSEAKRGHQ